MNCYCRLNRLDFAFSMLGKMMKLGFQPDGVTFNTLIHGLVVIKDVKEAAALLDRIRDEGFEVDVFTYGTLIKGFCKVRDSRGAIKLVRRMEAVRCEPTVVIYSTIIDCPVKDEMIGDALEMFREMKGRRLNSDVFVYTSLMRGLGRWDDARKMLANMFPNDVLPNVQTFSMLVYMLCKDCKPKEAEVIVKHMIARGEAPNVVTYNALIEGCCMIGKLERRLIGWISWLKKVADLMLLLTVVLSMGFAR